MQTIDSIYKEILKEVLVEGVFKNDRTGVGSYSIPGAQIKYDMSQGFPLLTIRKVPFKSVRVELEGFIKGINSKKWYQERGCKFWDEWCNPKKVPYGNDEETKAKMRAEDDLGIIYGNNWRGFHDPDYKLFVRAFGGQNFNGVDQLKNLVDTLKKDPASRRMMVYAWNPLALNHAALPACHDSWQVLVSGDKLHLIWRQRSCDLLLGIPANIASYATLLHLLALESGLKEGTLIGHLGDVHLYSNQIDAAVEYQERKPFAAPKIITRDFTNIFDWSYDQTKVMEYNAHERIDVKVAV